MSSAQHGDTLPPLQNEAAIRRPRVARPRTRRHARRWSAFSTHVALIVISAAFLLPLAWMVVGSIKPAGTLFKFPPSIFPKHPAYANYSDAATSIPFGRYILNSTIVSVASTVGTLFSGLLAGYAFALMRWRGRNVTFYIVLATIMLPFPVVMVPLYYIFAKIGWLGTLLPLIVPSFVGQYLTPYFSSALAIFLIRQFFLGLPYELVESARVDGASHWKILRSIILPNSRGVVIAVGIFTFQTSWTAFVGPLIFLTKQSTFTLSLGLQQYQSGHATEYDLLMAASVMFCVPLVVIFAVAQRWFIRGISFSGLKG